MVNWPLIILIVVALLLFLKMSPGARFGRTWTFVIGAFIIFVVVTLGFVITRPGIDVSSFDGFLSAIKVYFVWLGDLFGNAADLTGEAVNTNWAANFTE